MVKTSGVNGQPAYRAIANELRDAIMQNRYPIGHRLPTEGELAEAYGLGRQTIRRAYQELTSAGLIYRVRGDGTYAFPITQPLQSSFGHVADIVDPSVDDETEIITPLTTREPEESTARLLQLDDGEPCRAMTIRRNKLHSPMYFAYLRFPTWTGALLETEPALLTAGHRGHFTIIGLIDLHLPDTVANLNQTILAVTASGEVAESLGCEEGVPLLRVERVYFDKKGAPVELATTFYHPTNYVMRQRLRR